MVHITEQESNHDKTTLLRMKNTYYTPVMTHFSSYESTMSHKHIDTFLYLKIPLDESSTTISFYAAIPKNTMEKRLAFIPDPSELEPDEHLAVDKECYFCLTRTKCNCFKEFDPAFFDSFDKSEELKEPLYVCEDCRERIKAGVEKHNSETDFPEIMAKTI